MLNIEIDEHSGFCFGVTTAIGKAEEELAHSQRLYCLGDIVHNGSECERLRGMGLETIDHEAFRSLRNAKVLLRAHGEPPETYATASALWCCNCNGESSRCFRSQGARKSLSTESPAMRRCSASLDRPTGRPL